MRKFFIFFIFFIYKHVTTGSIIPDKISRHVHYRLKSDLLNDYDKTIRPIENHRNSTKVNIKMILKSLIYEMHSNTLSIHAWLALVWQDDHLAWNINDYENVGSITLSTDEIWTPDLSIYNGADQSGSQGVFSTVDCIVSSGGRVACIPSVRHDVLCMANVKKFPYDFQNCTLSFGSWVHSGEEIDFRLNKIPVSLEDYAANQEWRLLSVSTSRHTGHYDCCPNNTYPTLSYTFALQRHASYYGAIIIVPAILLAFMTIATFSFNALDSCRLILSCSNVIVHILIQEHITWQLPTIGDDPPLIILFGRDSLVLCALTVFLTIILRRILSDPNESPAIISNVVSHIMGSRAGQVMLLFDFNMKGMANAKCEDDGTTIIENPITVKKERDCLVFAKIVDRLFSLAYVIAYFFMFLAFIP